jgi:hypothetical protein
MEPLKLAETAASLTRERHFLLSGLVWALDRDRISHVKHHTCQQMNGVKVTIDLASYGTPAGIGGLAVLEARCSYASHDLHNS